jgi:hypothetical protein
MTPLLLLCSRRLCHCLLCCRRRGRCLCCRLYLCRRSVGRFPPPQCQATAGAATASDAATIATTPPLSLPPPDTACPSLLLIVDCCLLSAVVCICRCNCRRQHDIRQRFRHQRSLLCHASTVSTSSAALTFRPGGTSRGRGQGHHGQVLFGRERLKRSILVHILLNKEPSFVAGSFWREQESSGILRNPEES